MAKDDSFLTLKKQLKSKELKSLYLFYGDEVFIRDMYLSEMLKLIPDDGFSDFNKIIIDGKDLTIERADDAINSFPVMSDKKIVVIKSSGIFKSCPDDAKNFWQNIFSKLPTEVLLIFVETQIDKRSTLFKSANANGLCVDFAYMKDYEIVPWLMREASKSGKKISKDAAELLISLCDPGIINIKNQLDKLINYSGEEIYRSDIEKVVSKPMTLVVFEITDAIIEKNSDKAMSVILRMKENKESAFNILYLLSSAFDKMLYTKLALANGATFDTVSARLKLPPFIARKYADSAKKFSEDFLADKIAKTAMLDLSVKQGEVDEWTALFSYVFDCLNNKKS